MIQIKAIEHKNKNEIVLVFDQESTKEIWKFFHLMRGNCVGQV